MFLKLLTRFFGEPEPINAGGKCATYLYRWILFRMKNGAAVYIHHFVGDECDPDMHDHPKKVISIGLSGGYIEHTPSGQKKYRAPWIRVFPATHIHRLTVPSKSCWTICVFLKVEREWGFYQDGKFIHWRRYVTMHKKS